MHLDGHVRGLKRFIDVAAHGDRGSAVAPPHERLFQAHLGAANLIERDGASIGGREAEVGKPRGVEPFRSGAARHHVDGADVLAHLRDSDPAQKELELLCGFCRREPDEPQPVLIENVPDNRHALRPIAIDLPQVRIRAHHLLDLIGDLPHDRGVRTFDAKHDREGRRGAEYKLGHAYARFGREAVRNPVA